MSTKVIRKSTLFRTSAASDIQCAGGFITIPGLNGPITKKDVISIVQNKYRAEVAQVVTVGATTYTPANATTYSVALYDPLRTPNGYNELQNIYSVTTPADVTTLGNAAAQREWISAAIVAKINLASGSNHATAASLGSGNGFTITDAGGYFPVFTQGPTGVVGANTVYTITNPDSSGYQDNFSVTTAAVYSYGVGSKLATEKPIVDYVYGNVVSGYIEDAPLTTAGLAAVSGQNYDGFVFESYQIVDGLTLGGQFVYQLKINRVFVDNGTGSSTTNLAGFKAFEAVMLQLIFDTYAQDPSTIVYMNQVGPTCGGLNTGLPSGVSLAENFIDFNNGFGTHYYPLGTNTIVALTADVNGIGAVLDATAGEGVEISAPTWSTSLKSAVVGKTAFSIYVKIYVDDVLGVDPMWVGFRKKAAANTTYTAYTDYALIGLGNALGDIYTSTEINGGGNTNTDTTQNWTAATARTLEVRVDINGAVTFFIDGYKPTVTQAVTFDAGDEMIPVFCYALQAAAIGTPSLSHAAFVSTDSWRN